MNDRKNYFMINLHQSMGPAEIEADDKFVTGCNELNWWIRK